jgi:branched-chain amino acid transport system substrate-binding protein
MNKKIWLVGAVAVVLVVFGFFIGTKHTPQSIVERQEIKVGVIAPLSGEVAFLGEKMKKGIEAAIENADMPDNISFIYEDGGIEPRKALTAYQKLSSVDKVDYIIGPFGPDQILSIAPILKPDDIMLAVSLCEGRFAQYPQVFCTYPSIPDQVESSFPVMKSNNTKKVALITANSELGNMVFEELKKSEEALEYTVETHEKIKQGDKDFRTLIAKVKASGVDTVYIASLPDEGYLLLRQLSELQFTGTKIAIFDAVEEVLKEMSVAAEGVYFPGHISPNFEPYFTETFKEKNKEEPDLYAALGHSITTMLVEGLKDNNFKKDGLKDKLIGATHKTSIIDFTFNQDQTVSMPVETLVFKDGNLGQMTEI